MQVNDKTILEGYAERYRRLNLSNVLYVLERKTGKDLDGNSIDFLGLGLVTLLFFFENMLIRNHKVSVKNLAIFLARQMKGVYSLDAQKAEAIARDIITELRPSSGKRVERTFFNWENCQTDLVQYTYLKTMSFDAKTNTQYYALDDDGLELVFTTREFYSEFALSINQLLLRKQLEKGEFMSALRQIDEMQIDVNQLRERIERISHDIQRSIVSDEIYERFKVLLEDLNSRMERENEEFKELQDFVGQTRFRLTYDIRTEKEEQAFKLILKIDQRLSEVHHEHNELFKKGVELKTTALRAAQDALYSVGQNAFNFKEQLTEKLFSAPLALDNSRMLCEPMLYLERFETWSPLSVFGKQRLERKDENVFSKAYDDFDDDKDKSQYKEIMRSNYAHLTGLLMSMMSDDPKAAEAIENQRQEEFTISLEAVVDWIKNNAENSEMLLGERAFYDYWILLHQQSPICLENLEAAEVSLSERANEPGLLEPSKALLANNYSLIDIKPGDVSINPTKRYSITNMRIKMTTLGGNI